MQARARARRACTRPAPPARVPCAPRLLDLHQRLCSSPAVSPSTRCGILGLLRLCAGSARSRPSADDLLGSTVSYLSKVQHARRALGVHRSTVLHGMGAQHARFSAARQPPSAAAGCLRVAAPTVLTCALRSLRRVACSRWAPCLPPSPRCPHPTPTPSSGTACSSSCSSNRTRTTCPSHPRCPARLQAGRCGAGVPRPRAQQGVLGVRGSPSQPAPSRVLHASTHTWPTWHSTHACRRACVRACSGSVGCCAARAPPHCLTALVPGAAPPATAAPPHKWRGTTPRHAHHTTRTTPHHAQDTPDEFSRPRLTAPAIAEHASTSAVGAARLARGGCTPRPCKHARGARSCMRATRAPAHAPRAPRQLRNCSLNERPCVGLRHVFHPHLPWVIQ